MLWKPKGNLNSLLKPAAALFQPKSRRNIFQAGLLTWPATTMAFSHFFQAQWHMTRRQKIGLTVAVTARDLHPLPYSLVAAVGQRAPENDEKNFFKTSLASYHVFRTKVNVREKLKI